MAAPPNSVDWKSSGLDRSIAAFLEKVRIAGAVEDNLVVAL